MLLFVRGEIMVKDMKSRILVFFLVITLVVIGSVINNLFDKKDVGEVLVIDETFDLSSYTPFSDNNNLATLPNESNFKLNDHLPIIDGATAFYPLYASFVQAVYPDNLDYGVNTSEYVKCGKTSWAYNDLIQGEVDIIFVFGPSEEITDYADVAGVELEFTLIGKEAFVFFANINNPVDSLTVEEIKNIYSGETVNWKDVGGNNQEIIAYQRNESSGSQTALLRVMDEVEVMEAPGELIQTGMSGIILEVSSYQNNSNAIGYSFLYFATEMVPNDQIKLFAIDGIAPTKENIANGTYPFIDDFYAVTRKDKSKNTKKLLDWILSDEGQYLVKAIGYTPIK